jgi:hypothetical protein
VPSSFAESLYSSEADHMRYVAVNADQLDQFNHVPRITLWNHVPWVAKP